MKISALSLATLGVALAASVPAHAQNTRSYTNVDAFGNVTTTTVDSPQSVAGELALQNLYGANRGVNNGATVAVNRGNNYGNGYGNGYTYPNSNLYPNYGYPNGYVYYQQNVPGYGYGFPTYNQAPVVINAPIGPVPNGFYGARITSIPVGPSYYNNGYGYNCGPVLPGYGYGAGVPGYGIPGYGYGVGQVIIGNGTGGIITNSSSTSTNVGISVGRPGFGIRAGNTNVTNSQSTTVYRRR